MSKLKYKRAIIIIALLYYDLLEIFSGLTNFRLNPQNFVPIIYDNSSILSIGILALFANSFSTLIS
jgi:hypothetical protein